MQSEKGRQQYVIERVVGQSIVNTGYCVHPDIVHPETHLEQGPVWKWYLENIEDISTRLGAKYKQETAGALRKIKQENIEEIKKIFDITGGTALKVAWQFPLVVLVSLGLLQGKASGSEEGSMLGSAVLGACSGGTKCSFWA